MSNVLIDREKIDILANAISCKSGEPVTMTLDEMVEAVDGIETGGGGITPTGNINITQAGVTDVTNYATATVPAYTDVDGVYSDEFFTSGTSRRWHIKYVHDGIEGWFNGGIVDMPYSNYYSVIPAGTTVTPTESTQTIGAARRMMEGAVTVNAIPSNYVGSGITQRSSSDLTASGATVTVPSGYYSAQASKAVASGTKGTLSKTHNKTDSTFTTTFSYPNATEGYYNQASMRQSMQDILTIQNETVTPSTSAQVVNVRGNLYYLNSVTVEAMPSGTEGTPTATKGTVSNHSVTVTPSVTNSAGYISGGTKTGTAVSVSASELVSGSQTITENSTVDVTNLAEVVVNVSGGGGGGIQVGTKTTTLASASSSISFTGLSGNPTSFAVTSTADQTTGADKVIGVVYDGTDLHGQTITTQIEYETGFTKSYSSGTLTITATTAQFQANEYKLVYTYGGSTSDVETADVQVGSGATSITFNVTGRPLYWSCIFKSTFSTSSGYQRVVGVVNDGSNIYGHAMDSQANAETFWTGTYSGGSLTIASQGTNQGGYFHQPGYYQLTYVVDESAPSYQTKTVTPTTSQQIVTADNGYDALSQVTVNAIPSQYVVPTGNLNITQNGSNINVAQYSTVSVNVSGGGGSSKNVQVLQSTSRTNASSLTKVLGDLTVSKTGTYDVYWSGGRSNTSTGYTWGTMLYVDGSGYGTENTSWSNNCQSNHLSNVSLTANQKLSVYARGRTGSYYTFAPMLVIIEA